MGRSVQESGGAVRRALPVALLAVACCAFTPLRLPHRLPARVVRVPIIEYHRVGSPGGLPALTVAPAAFAAQMEWLHAHAFHAITQRQLFDALERGARLPRRPVLITFDDGYRDVLWNAVPVLRRLRMPATVYVIVDRVGSGDSSFLDWPELARLERMGFSVGSHTVHHVPLTALPDAAVYEELRASRVRLERRLHVDVQWLSYPFGAADPRIARIAAAAGYVLGVTERPGVRQTAAEPLLLSRDEILSWTGVTGLRTLVESGSR